MNGISVTNGFRRLAVGHQRQGAGQLHLAGRLVVIVRAIGVPIIIPILRFRSPAPANFVRPAPSLWGEQQTQVTNDQPLVQIRIFSHFFLDTLAS
ncbi:MAG TPA: hypothetical protein VN765_02705 [Candidatus Acidoferrum sp.]|nr:hypothetical protein [Candidatus Acidoferrum sp.]